MSELGIEMTAMAALPQALASSRSLAVFDIDGTLYSANTLYECLEGFHTARATPWRWFFRSARTRPGQFFWAAIARLARADLCRRIAFRSLRGIDVCSLDDACRAYVHDILPDRQISQTLALLNACGDRGYDVRLVSGSMGPLVRHIARVNGIDKWLAAEPDVSMGHYTGAIADDVQGSKLAAVEQAWRSFDELIVVTDNKNDLPLVKRADHAWVITKAGNVDWWCRHQLAHVSLIEV
ncbi:HAD-IB family phosphatase [Salinisphaera sp. T31B1]|uniref:HAD family hydrolase n=1 Tax=Salinisphaera sp. T31B1 TaxID=727963 RepID=UPI00333E467B